MPVSPLRLNPSPSPTLLTSPPTRVADPGYLCRILDPNFFHTGSRIRIKELKYFNPKHCFSALENMTRVVYPGSGSRIRILIFYPSRIPGSKRHRIPDPNPHDCLPPSSLLPSSTPILLGVVVTKFFREKINKIFSPGWPLPAWQGTGPASRAPPGRPPCSLKQWQQQSTFISVFRIWIWIHIVNPDLFCWECGSGQAKMVPKKGKKT